MAVVKLLIKTLFISVAIFFVLLLGFLLGRYSVFIENYPARPTSTPLLTPSASPTPQPRPQSPTPLPQITWGGPELWAAINKKRVELGVGPLGQKAELCTIASIRLNEILKLGDLDAHQGFSSLPTRRPDLKWIFEKYDLAEYLISGVTTPEEAVSRWGHTLGHRSLLAGGEFVWGCVYAQNGYAVAIAAF